MSINCAYLRADKDVKRRIDLWESQSNSIAKLLTKASHEHNETAFREYASRLAENRGRIDELRWVLCEKGNESVLGLYMSGKAGSLTVRETIGKLRSGELKMDDLSRDAQAMVRKGALELRNSEKQ